MNLHDFVSKSLVEIVKGINSPCNELKKCMGSTVNPNTRKVTMWESSVREIEFDVSVSTSDEGDKSSSFNIEVASIKLGRSKENDGGQSSQTKIRFTSPLMIPVGAEPRTISTL